MKKLVIYRCLPLKEWHQPFEATGSKWYAGGYKDKCECPYGRHGDVRFLDYKDPLNLSEILSLKEGMKLLTLYSWKGTEHVAFHTFKKFEFCSDFMRLLYKEEVSTYGNNEDQFTPIRLIAVIDDEKEITAFGKKGGMDVFIAELSRISGSPIEEIKRQIEELDAMIIPSELKISVNEIIENAKKTGRLAPIFW